MNINPMLAAGFNKDHSGTYKTDAEEAEEAERREKDAKRDKALREENRRLKEQLQKGKVKEDSSRPVRAVV